MKKIFYYIYAVVLTLGLASCAKENITVPEDTPQMTITATLGDEESTKTSLFGDEQTGYKVFWTEGDQIKIYNPKDSQYHTYTLSAGEGTTVGVFTGDQLQNGTYTATFGTDFTYEQESGTLAAEQHFTSVTDASFVPMAAKVNVWNGETTYANFKNITGFLRLSLDGIGTLKSIKVITDQYISGMMTLENDGSAKVEQTWLVSNKNVTLACENDGIDLGSDAKTFYISLPKGEYAGLKIEFRDSYGFVRTKTLKADKKLIIARSKINPISLTVNFPSHKTKAKINGQQVDVRWFQLWENGPKWAEYDVGVTDGKPESIGGRYYMRDGDPAINNWGTNWQTPAVEDFRNLLANCNYSKATLNGVLGYRFTGKDAYNVYSIFFPDTYIFDDGDSHSYHLSRSNVYNIYWFYSLYTSYFSGSTWINETTVHSGRAEAVRAIVK